MDGQQLTLDLTGGRRYRCCGMPAPALNESGYPSFPHAAECPNQAIRTGWIDRWGRQIRALSCGDSVMAGRKPCPHDGRFRCSANMVDPYDGMCCLEIRTRVLAAAEQV